MHVFKSIFIIIFLFFFVELASAQIAAKDTGKIELVQDFKIKQLLAKQVDINSKAHLKGYRIKIHFGSDKNKASEIKSKFISKFPDVTAYGPIYDQPNFSIRVGDFRTKLEAYKLFKKIQVEFPSAFIVQDEIELPDLNPSDKK